MALVSGVTIMGSALNAELRNALTKCEMDASLNQVVQLSMEFMDPRWALLQKGVFTLGQRVEVGKFRLEIANIETGDKEEIEHVEIKCRPVAVRLLKNRRGPRVMSGVSPSEFVIAECQAVGIGYVVQPSARRGQVSRDILENGQKPDVQNPPSSWTTFSRLANELGYIIFENCDVVYFGKPSWLLQNASLDTFNANYITGAVDDKRTVTVPKCRRTQDDPAVSVSMGMIVQSVDEVRPGKKLALKGVPTFEGDYLITEFKAELLEPLNVVAVSAATPKDPDPQPNPSSSRITGPWYDEDAL